jgi:hypothetical protein
LETKVKGHKRTIKSNVKVSAYPGLKDAGGLICCCLLSVLIEHKLKGETEANLQAIADSYNEPVENIQASMQALQDAGFVMAPVSDWTKVSTVELGQVMVSLRPSQLALSEEAEPKTGGKKKASG